MVKSFPVLLAVFSLALAIRLFYFPDDVYFAYDQARDSYTSLELLKGDFKIVGPPSAAGNNLFSGPLIYYLYAPVYFFADKSPEALSFALRILNASGVFLVFAVATILFNKKAGLLASLFYALSYEQTQYSLFLSHQPQAVIGVLLFYLGLAITVFRNNSKGLMLSAVGSGLAAQFHYLYLYLPIVWLLTLIIFGRTNFLKTRTAIFAALLFLFSISTYIVSEIKFNFRTTLALLELGQTSSSIKIKEVVFVLQRFLHDNFLADYSLVPVVGILLLSLTFYFLLKKGVRQQTSFLVVWFVTSLIPYFISGTPSYYYSAAINVSLFVFVSFVIVKILQHKFILAFILIASIVFSNINLIRTINPTGLNQYMIIQPGMLISDQKKILDYVYTESQEKDIAVRALTVPLNVNTTWSYLFEWYGKQKYDYAPKWIGPAAEGFPGGLEIENNRGKLPQTQFLIIEPTIGIREGVQEEFFREEGYFTKIVEEKQFGTLKVQKRQRF